MQMTAAVLHLNTKFIKCIAPNFPASLYSCVLRAHYQRCVLVCGLSRKPPVQAAGRQERSQGGRAGCSSPGDVGGKALPVSCVNKGNGTQFKERSGFTGGNPGASVPESVVAPALWGRAGGPWVLTVGCPQVSALQGQLAMCREHPRAAGPPPP